MCLFRICPNAHVGVRDSWHEWLCGNVCTCNVHDVSSFFVADQSDLIVLMC